MSSNGSAPRFTLPEIPENDGWGPPPQSQNLEGIPYQHYSRDVKIGKIADWINAAAFGDSKKSRYGSYNNYGSQFSAQYDENDYSYHMVYSGRDNKSSFSRQKLRFNMQKMKTSQMQVNRKTYMRQQASNPVSLNSLGFTKKNKMIAQSHQKDRRHLNKRYNIVNTKKNVSALTANMATMNISITSAGSRRAPRKSSVQIEDVWEVKEEIEFHQLSKLMLPGDRIAEDLRSCGSMEYYDRMNDRITPRNPKQLGRVNRLLQVTPTIRDPVICSLAKEGAGNVFATDSVIAALMCCSRSIYSFDVMAYRVGDQLFLDKRPNNQEFDYLTVAETANDPPNDLEPDSINSAKLLALEATCINFNFIQQVLRHNDAPYAFPEPNPFIEDFVDDSVEPGSIGYRYRRFNLGNDINLVVRCQHDAVLSKPIAAKEESAEGKDRDVQFLTIRALNEWDSRMCGAMDWRSKLEPQPGAVMANEMKNNSYKLAKWVISALLAGSDILKIGFLSRILPNDSSRHEILGTETVVPAKFAKLMNLNLVNAWGILRCLIDKCMSLPSPGNYLFVKDPAKSILRIYQVPEGAFEEEESDEDELETVQE